MPAIFSRGPIDACREEVTQRHSCPSEGGCPTKTAGVLELCIYKLCFKSVKNTQMIKGEFFTALDVSPLCVFLHVLPLSVLFPQGIPHVLDTWQTYMDRDCLLLAAMQVLLNVTSKSACDLLPLLFCNHSSQDEVMLLWRCQVRGKTAQ